MDRVCGGSVCEAATHKGPITWWVRVRWAMISYRSWAVAFRQVSNVTHTAGEGPPESAAVLPILDEHLLEADEPRPDRVPSLRR